MEATWTYRAPFEVPARVTICHFAVLDTYLDRRICKEGSGALELDDFWPHLEVGCTGILRAVGNVRHSEAKYVFVGIRCCRPWAIGGKVLLCVEPPSQLRGTYAGRLTPSNRPCGRRGRAVAGIMGLVRCI